jgi:hypothetical protein
MYTAIPAIPSATITNAKVSVLTSMTFPFIYTCAPVISSALRFFNRAEVAAPNAGRRGQGLRPPETAG